jgi:hypothetical protein
MPEPRVHADDRAAAQDLEAVAAGDVSAPMLMAALGYARRGRPVLPVDRAKRPLGALVPRGLRHATTDLGTIEGWWRRRPDANVAIRTDGLLVIDIDGEPGRASLRGLMLEHGDLTPTLEQATPRGGRHLVYLAPVGMRLSNSPRPLGSPSGIDLRAGDRGYIVVAPSRTGAGAYRWLNRLPVAELPPTWAELLRRPEPVDPAAIPARLVNRESGYGAAALDGELDRVRNSSEGRRNSVLNEAAFALGQLEAGGELPVGLAQPHLLTAALHVGLSTVEATRTIASGLTAGQRHPRSAPRNGGSRGA